MFNARLKRFNPAFAFMDCQLNQANPLRIGLTQSLIVSPPLLIARMFRRVSRAAWMLIKQAGDALKWQREFAEGNVLVLPPGIELGSTV